MPGAVEHDLFVDLVGHHQQVVFDGDLGQFLQFFARIDAPGGIGRVDQDDHARTGAEPIPDRCAVQRKIARTVQRRRNHHAARKFDLVDVLRVVRRKQHHLVTRVQGGHAGDVGPVR